MGVSPKLILVGLLREGKGPDRRTARKEEEPIGAKSLVNRLAFTRPSALTLWNRTMRGIDEDQDRLTAINRSFGWPKVRPFGDGRRFASHFNVAEPNRFSAKDRSGSTTVSVLVVSAPKTYQIDFRSPVKIRNSGKLVAGFYLVMAQLFAAISIIGPLCLPDRHRQDKPGDDESAAATTFALLTKFELTA
jgi:hypothetical protein